MSQPIVLDIETQYAFQEVNYDYKKLKVSVVGIYDYTSDKYLTYEEKELPKLFHRLEHASYLIGFNIKKFDLPVLSPYYLGKIEQFETLDILEEVEKKLGHRLALDDLLRATLGVKKTGHGFLALDYFRNKEWDKLKSYCLDDVRLTKDLFEYGRKNGKLYFLSHTGKREIPVNFLKSKPKNTPVSLSLPF